MTETPQPDHILSVGLSHEGSHTIHAVRSRRIRDTVGAVRDHQSDRHALCGCPVPEVEPFLPWGKAIAVDIRKKCKKCQLATGLLAILLTLLVSIASAADRPIVTIYTQDGCAPCRVAKRELAEARDLPFDVQFSEKLPSWVEMVPVAVWKTDEPRQFAGWHGTKRLVEVWHKTHDEIKPAEPRSPQWRTVRNAHIEANPNCIVCGVRGTQVHHLHPFNLFPDRELDPTNLRTVCDRCHIGIAHLGNFKNYNPDLDYHADILLHAKQEADKRRLTPKVGE